ncbi:MAG: hypothetical protein HUJ29_06240 [Gammaproteobacteria bacterium]|nr:hypothetical protein [Gammaproteobacteria bacterium]
MKKSLIFILSYLLIIPTSFALDKISKEEFKSLLTNGIVINAKMTESEILKTLGKPTKKEIRPSVSNHDDSKVEFIKLIYSGLEITLHKPTQTQGPASIVYIKVKNNNYKLQHGLFIGMQEHLVRELFSYAREDRYIDKDNIYLFYTAPDSVHDQIVIKVTNGKASSISWSNMP